MTGFRDHPLDAPLNAMVQALTNADKQLGQMADGIGDFDSQKLTPEEDVLIFHNPSLRYINQVNPTTGMPYTNAEAAQKLLSEVGPDQYVKYVEDFVQRDDRRQANNSPTTSAAIQAPQPAPMPAPPQPQPEQPPEPMTEGGPPPP